MAIFSPKGSVQMETGEEVQLAKDLHTKHGYPSSVSSTLSKIVHDVHIHHSTAREAEG